MLLLQPRQGHTSQDYSSLVSVALLSGFSLGQESSANDKRANLRAASEGLQDRGLGEGRLLVQSPAVTESCRSAESEQCEDGPWSSLFNWVVNQVVGVNAHFVDRNIVVLCYNVVITVEDFASTICGKDSADDGW